MVLADSFYYQPVQIDTINTRVNADLFAKEGDANGRGMVVQITENGIIKDTTGVTLRLQWSHISVGVSGFTDFEVVDATKGLYKLQYPTSMLHRGRVEAFIRITDNGVLSGTRNLLITVERMVGSDETIEASDDFSALQTALTRLSIWEATISGKIDTWEADMEATKQLYIDTLSAAEAAYPQELVSLKGQLADVGLQIKTKSKWDLEHSALGLLQKYAFPDADFNGFPIKLMTDGYQFYWFFDITAYKHVGGTTYYISPTGSDAKDGLTEGTARKIMASVPAVDGDTIILLDGIYPRTIWTNDTAIEKSINIIAKNPGKVIVKNANNHTYGLYSTYTKTYFTARSNVANVIQMLDDATTTELVNVASIALVESTEGSWFNNGVNTYVHLFNDVTPSDNNCVLNLITHTALFQTLCATKNVEIYVEGIKFIGGHKGTLRFSASANYRAPKLYANKCQFLHAHDTIASPSFDAVSILGATAYFVDCEASFSNKDGFNYHQFDGTISYGLEINCIGKCNGYGNASGAYNNGSTAHDGSKVIRIEGMYHSNYGANVADVHVNTKSLNIECKAFNSTAGTGDGSDADFAAQQTGTTMWLQSCRGLGSKYNLYCAAGASMYVKDSDYTTKNFSGNIVDLA